MFLVLYIVTLCVCIAACLPRLAPTPATPCVWGGDAPRAQPPKPCRSHPAQVVVVVVVVAAVSGPAVPLLDWPQGPDPLPRRRASIRHSTRTDSLGRGNGCESPVGGRSGRGSDRVLHPKMGQWRYGRGPSCRGCVAVPLHWAVTRTASRDPPPRGGGTR